jgi:hypothetical protein
MNPSLAIQVRAELPYISGGPQPVNSRRSSEQMSEPMVGTIEPDERIFFRDPSRDVFR